MDGLDGVASKVAGLAKPELLTCGGGARREWWAMGRQRRGQVIRKRAEGSTEEGRGVVPGRRPWECLAAEVPATAGTSAVAPAVLGWQRGY